MSPDVSKRLLSLDLFRGLTIAAMIIVNNLGTGQEGARFRALVHSQWHGCTPADLIFPFFVFIVGVAAVFSLGRRAQTEGQSLIPVYRHIFSRTLKIFLLGLLVTFACGWLFQAICPPAETEQSLWSIFLAPPTDTNTGAFFYSLSNLRLPGVLQRLALVYLAVALLALHSRWRTQALVAAALLLGYWGLMTLTGFGLEAGEDLGSLIDRLIFGHDHLYLRNWDPEGLLSTLPAIATGLLGALTGHWLKSERTGRRKLVGLLLFGVIGIAAGWLWGLTFPINKNLWTSSYVLFTGGFALLFLGGLYYWFDLRKAAVSWASPFIWLGTRPLLAYCGSQVMFLALYTLYVGNPWENTNLLTLIHNALFGEHWDILGETAWSDPRWPSLYWGLVCLSFWTLLVGPLPRQLAALKPAARKMLASMRKVEYWGYDQLPGGYLGG